MQWYSLHGNGSLFIKLKLSLAKGILDSVMVQCQCPVEEVWSGEQMKLDFPSVTVLSGNEDF